jgi:hypothetical protein
MKAKEKAAELFDKMLYNDGDKYHHCSHYVAKNCTLIAVDEILSVVWYVPIDIEYWQEVKQEIQKL